MLLQRSEAIGSGSLGDITAINGMWTAFKTEDYFNSTTTWRREKGGGCGLDQSHPRHRCPALLVRIGFSCSRRKGNFKTRV